MPTAPPARPKLVLLVDDDDDIREVASTALRLVDGFHIVTATNGHSAVEQAQQHRPDAILLDVMMPGIDGLETVSMLKATESTADIPVILLTARVDREAPIDNVDGLIAKPFDPMRLGTEVRRILGWAQ